jgi:hypothetical protein
VGRLLVPYCLTGDNIPHTTCTDWAVTCSSAGVTASKPQITPAFIIFWLGGATRFPMYVIIRDFRQPTALCYIALQAECIHSCISCLYAVQSSRYNMMPCATLHCWHCAVHVCYTSMHKLAASVALSHLVSFNCLFCLYCLHFLYCLYHLYCLYLCTACTSCTVGTACTFSTSCTACTSVLSVLPVLLVPLVLQFTTHSCH